MINIFVLALLPIILFMHSTIIAENKGPIMEFCSGKISHPFNYDLDVKLIQGDTENSDYMICCHGSGTNNKIADTIKSYGVVKDYLVSFNFPSFEEYSSIATCGAIHELAALYVLKNVVIDGGLNKINLYGFSAGGGVIINVLSVLSNNRFEQELLSIGITQEHRQQILAAIANWLTILDCPLKSIEEIIAFKGGNDTCLDHILQTYAQKHAENELRPIDSIKTWKNVHLKILLYFEVPDEMLSNRDDALFSQLIERYNLGSTTAIHGSDGGHFKKHSKLWDCY